MRCEVARNLMSAYADNEINEIEKRALEKHLTECVECREEYELLLEVMTGCASLEEKELPSGFGDEMHQLLLNEKSVTKKNGFISNFNRNNKWKMASGLVAAVLVVALALGGAYSNILENKGIGYRQNKAVAPLMDGSTGNANFTVNDQSASSGASNGGAAVERKSKMLAPSAAPTPEAAPPVENVGTAAPNDVIVNFAEAVEPNNDQSGQVALTSRASTEGRKVIKTGNLALKVTKLDSRIDEIRKLAEQNGGYVENSAIDNIEVNTVNNPSNNEVISKSNVKTANIAIRVPAQSFDTAFGTIKTMGTTTSENVSGNDITYQYRDTYTRVENLRVQEKRLLDLMTKAKNVDELLRIENELNRVRTDIEMMSGDLKRWDDLVDLSSIYINLTEVKEGELNRIDVPNVWSKAYKGFIDAINKILLGLEKLFVFVVTAVPYLIILGVLSAIAIIFIRRYRNKHKA